MWAVGYYASQISLFLSSIKKQGYLQIPDGEEEGGDDISGANDQSKLFVGTTMLFFSETLALYGLIVALFVTQYTYSCVLD